MKPEDLRVKHVLELTDREAGAVEAARVRLWERALQDHETELVDAAEALAEDEDERAVNMVEDRKRRDSRHPGREPLPTAGSSVRLAGSSKRHRMDAAAAERALAKCMDPYETPVKIAHVAPLRRQGEYGEHEIDEVAVAVGELVTVVDIYDEHPAFPRDTLRPGAGWFARREQD